MKKVFLLLAFCFSLIFTANAQDDNGYKNAIGVRAGWGVQASYQRYVLPQNRVEVNLGINRFGFDAAGIYQYVFNIPSNTKGIFKWYAGMGATMGDWSFDDAKDEGFSFGIVGQIGLEYTFRIPLLLSFDYRPGWYFTPESEFDWSGFAVGVRYCF